MIHVGSTRYTGTVQANSGLLAPTLDEAVVDEGVIVEAVPIKNGLVDGVDVSDHAARHQVGGADALAVLDFFNGTFLESFDALVTSDGATVTMSIEKVGGGDLTENFSSGQTIFDCTPAATIALTAGTDAVPVGNRVYILQSAPGVLVKSTTGWPSAEHNKIAFFSVPSASLVNTGASGNNFVYANQNWNDNAAESATDQGHMADMAERLRRLPASWFSGCQGVATQDGNDLWISVATGVVYQLHPHTFPALDSDTAGAGDPILVVNDPDANNAIINSLNEITKHSDGDLIGSNKYVKFVLSGVANKTGEVSLMLLNLPSEHYNTAADARNDVEGYANFTLPAAFSLESSTGFLIAAFVCKHTATAMELQETIDLRGQIPTTASGSGTGGGDVSAAAVLTDNAVVRGDGGAKGVQTSGVLVDDSDNMSGIGNIALSGTVDGVNVSTHAADGDAHHSESHDADSHSDVDTTTDPPALNDVMKWNGSDWVPGTAGDTTEFTFGIDSFAGTETDSNQLIGSGTWVASGAMSFSATYSNAPGGMTALVTMTGTATGWSTLVMDPVTGAEPTVADTSYPSSPGDTVTFTLTQSADGSTAVDTVQFNNTMRYGTNSLTQGGQTEASLEALTEVAGPNESRNQTIFNIPNDPANYVTFAYATRLTAIADIEQIRVNSGLGWVTAAFAAAATTLKPDLQAAVANVDNSASFVENFDCVTSLIAGLANGTNDFQILTTPTASNYMFWGELAKASGYTEADVEDNIASEPGQVVSNDMSSREMTVNAAVDEYTYIAYPARLGALTSIMIGGFESIDDFNVDSTTLAITNDAGYQENYRVYVSVNPGFTDPTTMTVTI